MGMEPEESTPELNNIATCPECGAEIRFKKAPYLGQEVICRRCDSSLEVVERFPIELSWADTTWEEEDFWEEEDIENFEPSKTNRRKNDRW